MGRMTSANLTCDLFSSCALISASFAMTLSLIFSRHGLGLVIRRAWDSRVPSVCALGHLLPLIPSLYRSQPLPGLLHRHLSPSHALDYWVWAGLAFVSEEEWRCWLLLDRAARVDGV
ncbi:hypothetical protein BDN70DRAFT_43674 [Pholiota conissans]|uniref:Uncharacterized protein n=1 Tax=Pholiota conissans TaxID=109636 RepID=A0A9P6CZN5_9AGAR|nr:hypothetical protein BDN70DRAFT_43674 [Pholiota conissans]